jgi:hypothetical protein
VAAQNKWKTKVHQYLERCRQCTNCFDPVRGRGKCEIAGKVKKKKKKHNYKIKKIVTIKILKK